MPLTLDQVLQMAPDGSSAAAAKKLVGVKNWQDLGQSAEAMWGKCQGSAVYQVKIDLSNLGYHCSCPSRKFPCKHVLGLLMLSVQTPESVVAAESPDWIQEWLQKRRGREEKQAEKKSAAADKPVDVEAQKKRMAQREGRILEGIKRLDLWMTDLVRSGLAGIEQKPGSFWEEQAKRLVDAQAGGLASRVSRLSEIPRSGTDWPQRLLAEMGRIRLLTHAYSRLSDLSPELQSEIRQLIGWNLSQEELEREGKRLQDSWVVIGQTIDDDGRIRTQRSWLIGRQSNQIGMVLQFAAGPQPFAESIMVGTEVQGTLQFYPGTLMQRAKFAERTGGVTPVEDRLPGFETVGDFLESSSEVFGGHPWVNATAGVLRNASIFPHQGRWIVRDSAGEGLPVGGRPAWKLLAISGGRPVDLAGEWNGFDFTPMGYMIDGAFGTP